MQTIAELLDVLPQIGRVTWIGASPRRRAEITPLDRVELLEKLGLREDYHAKSGRSKRQVTLIQAEHLAVVGSLLGREPIVPSLLRRNLAVAGINLLALKDQYFEIGSTLLQGTGLCAPCSRMEELLGPGGYNAMRGHGGITARVIRGGWVAIDDPIRRVQLESTL